MLTTTILILLAVFLTIKWCKRMVRLDNERYRETLRRSDDPGDKALLRAFEAMDEDRRARGL